MSRRLPWRLADPADSPFPPAEAALEQPAGLLAIGGDLQPVRLLNAYAGGIFPWFSGDEPILWWSPDPRMVFQTDRVHRSRRFVRQLRHVEWIVTADTAFEQVMRACAQAPRPGQEGTWISEPMVKAYVDLHRLGFAHSVEVWQGATLVGGIYGIGIGQMFFGESMFSALSGGSKVALSALATLLRRQGVAILDAQVENPHLLRMGAERWPRDRFLAHVRDAVQRPGQHDSWAHAVGSVPASDMLGRD